jgi:hypothetical protein
MKIQDAFSLLQMIQIGEKEVAQGKFKDSDEVFANIRHILDSRRNIGEELLRKLLAR